MDWRRVAVKTIIVDILMPPGQKIPSCVCNNGEYGATRLPDGGYEWNLDPECPYHQLAAKYPHDHRIPWNCPTFYDGCNCD